MKSLPVGEFKAHFSEVLEKGFEQRSGLLQLITTDYSFEDLRSDPRYADLVRRMGLEP